MKLLIDSANIEKIKVYMDYLPIEGVTTNPSIIKKEGNINVVTHLKEIRSIIGMDKSLHVQVISQTYEGMLKDAYDIVNTIDENVIIKIPVNKEGLKAIKKLKSEGFKITATAIYSIIQGYLATELGVDYLAPYVNRMQNLGINPYEVISSMAYNINESNKNTVILGASYKNVYQITDSIIAGANHITVGTDVIDNFLIDENINKAVQDFTQDWILCQGKSSFL